jgi:MFS family permease
MTMLENYKSPRNRGIRIISISVFSIIVAIILYSFFSSHQSLTDITRLYNLAIAVIILILVSLAAIGYGSYLILYSESLKPEPKKSYLGYISMILTNKTYWKIFIASSIVYGIFFGFLSQILIYHADVEGNTAPSLSVTLCCNYPGYVPMITIELTEIFSILIIPLNLILAIAVSLLVGFNFALNVYFLKIFRDQSQRKFSITSTFGVFSGLFIGCPTCAGSLFSVLVGFGTSATISALAPFQSLFIVITIPILIGTPLLIIRKIIKNENCNIIDR